MTTESNYKRNNKPYIQGNLITLNSGHINQTSGVLDMLKRDRFELLSAYLDGEVTAAERRQVEEWLANDPETKRLYARLIKLRQDLRMLPVPPAEQPVEQTIQQVYQRLNRRYRQNIVWGGTAIAAMFIGALSGVLPTPQSIQVATLPKSGTGQIEPLMVALNNPVIEIPKAAVAAPEQPGNQMLMPRHYNKQNLN